jgi:hypothetical protein
VRVASIVQGFLDQKQIFKGIADGTKDSLRVMTDGLKDSVSKQKQELHGLDAHRKKLSADDTPSFSAPAGSMEAHRGMGGGSAGMISSQGRDGPGGKEEHLDPMSTQGLCSRQSPVCTTDPNAGAELRGIYGHRRYRLESLTT